MVFGSYISPSTPEQKMEAGYLARCSPQTAYDWLQARAPKTMEQAREAKSLLQRSPDLPEYILVRRDDRLIDLGLARFALTARAVRRVYRRGDAACRIAAWSNIGARGTTLRSDIWAHEDNLARLASYGHEDELVTMGANPALGEMVLSNLLGRKGPFEALPDRRWVACLVGLSENPRLKEEYGYDRPMDGYAEYSHNKVFGEVWGLASTLPVQQEWAALLERLLRDCRPPYGMPEQAEALLERWRIDLPRKPGGKYYNPGPSYHLRTRLADLLKPEQALASSDRAVRLSFWSRFDPRQHLDWPEAMDRAFEGEEEQDAHDVLWAAMRNLHLWQTEERREALKALCWRTPDARHDMMMPNTYRGFERRHATEHPEWFRDAPDPALSKGPDPEPAWAARLAESMRPSTSETEPSWATALSEKVDDLAERTKAPAVDPRPWWSYVPWWLWMGAGALAVQAFNARGRLG